MSLTTIKRTALAALAAIAMVAMTTSTALAAGPDYRVIVVEIADGSGATPSGQEADPESALTEAVDFSNVEADLFIQVDHYGVSAYWFGTDDDGNSIGGGAGPDGVSDKQRELGDTATGLLSAGRNCQGEYFCHVILVNYQRPASREHRVAAKAAADELAAAGHKLHSVAVGPDSPGHLGFNWHLSGQAFNAESDQADELINRVAGYTHLVSVIRVAQHAGSSVDKQWRQLSPIEKIWLNVSTIVVNRVAGGGIGEQWRQLSHIEKIWLNPLDCDLETQWLWSSDATCHDKQ